MNRKRILFVDDEAQILDGLRNLLRKQRGQWDMGFALGGQEALAQLERGPIDVIVTDMRMPGMDGATLLEHVKERYPRIARIVLSGNAESALVVRAVPVANQYLSKPCEAEVLRGAIERVCQFQTMVQNETIQHIVGQLETLPSVPRVYWELTRAVQRETVGIAALADIVETDPAMSAKVLQLVNSAYFGLAQRLSSIHKAVAYLGVETLRGLALSAHVFAQMEAVSIPGFSIDQLQRASLLTARVAKRIAPSPGVGEEAFATGMVRDIGKLILALGMSQQFRKMLDLAGKDGRSCHEVEQEVFGVTHAEVGAYLLGVWGLPFPMVETVAFHHTPSLVHGDQRDLLVAVHVAEALVESALAEVSGRPAQETLDLPLLEAMNLTAQLPAWQAVARHEVLATSNKE